ncbi:DUF3570 domain-containing protein [Adhaeribacter sp. BT258]|uniref:DUF3570 domain-containing protein n=1 Tax=Adhaeribacter terrigena TaxID=2793070 RepID=A0ABS1C1I2_9BACT|nr:DUF3570 domain-containing protein [Adhaeribacter terrigena]MBK0403026.1 DUF3570 domain-containing protein [Adhaeribacter terrigena]
MQKLFLGASAFYLSIVCSFAQSPAPDSAAYQSRKLKLDEVDFVSSYYVQDGNHSAVTGGKGDEHLTDFANALQLNFLRTDSRQRLHTFGLELGIDHYTSASSDKIDSTTISSASSADTRYYPSLSWSMHDEPKHYTVGVGLLFSTEYDYFSSGAFVSYSKFSEDNNRELGLKFNVFLDSWKVIYPVELRGFDTPTGRIENPAARGTKPRNTYNGSFSLLQVISKRLQVALLADVAYQSGQLGTLYQRVYFTDGSHNVERLPESRFKLPVGLRSNYFLGDKIVFRSFYRYYTDDWGISAHTLELEVPYKFSPFFSVSPFYRYFTQTAADYFAPYRQHQASEEFYTSDFDLSAFDSHFIGTNVRFNSANGILGINHLNTLELRYGHYSRTNGLQANIITLAATVK